MKTWKDERASSPSASGAASFDDAIDRWLVEDSEFRWEYEAERLKLGFAAEVDSLRQELGLTQQELAERCETSQPTISRFFSGEDERSPTLMTLIKMADAVGKRIGLILEDWSVSIRDWRDEIDGPADSPWSFQRDSELAKEAAPIARNATLRSIDLVSINAEKKAEKRAGEEFRVSGRHSVRHTLVPETEDANSRLTVFCAFLLDVWEGDEALFSFRAEFSLTYDLNRGMPEDAAKLAGAFAETNSVLHAWPYFRELAQSTAWRMGFPPFPLPLFRIVGPRREAPAKD